LLPTRATATVGGLAALLTTRDIKSLDQIRGRMHPAKVNNPTLFERANYVRMLQDDDTH